MKLIKYIIQSKNKESTLDGNVVYGPKSIHICQAPSFLGTKRVETEHGLKLCLMYQQSSNSWTYRYASFDSLGLHM